MILNVEQLRAVEHGKRSLLVLAGAGTGKTSVLVARIVHQVGEKSVSLAKARNNRVALSLRDIAQALDTPGTLQ